MNPFDENKGRIEGVHKVTGSGKYSAEYKLPKMAYGVFVTSDIASGKITNLDTSDAKSGSGVIDVFSHLNNLPVPYFTGDKNESRLPVFHTDRVYYNGQPIALLIAESLEEAMYAATLVKVEYEEEPFKIDFLAEKDNFPLEEVGEERGSLEKWEGAPVVVDSEYTIQMEVHNPMEPHATIADWSDDGQLTVYDKSQNVYGFQRTLADLFEVPEENIRVVSEFVGGGFGSGLRVWYNSIGAVMASKMLSRPVKVVLTRPQMFTMVGHRPYSWQKVRVGMDINGHLLGVHHQAQNATSVFSDHTDNITGITRKVYGLENVKTEMSLVKLNIPKPTWMRGPGDSTGSFGIESAIDELCYLINADPVEVRLKNIAKYQMETGNPWSSHFLHECLEQGAETIGWQERPQIPGTLSNNGWQIGYGVAVGLWNARRKEAAASMEMSPNGKITVRSAMTDIGTGTGQAMWNITKEITGMPGDRIKVELGDTKFPYAPSQGGSWGLASLSAAIVACGQSLKEKMVQYAWGEDKPVDVDQVILSENGISLKNKVDSLVLYEDLFEKSKSEVIKVLEFAAPGEEQQKYGFVSSAAHFYKVRVHEKSGQVKIERMVIVVDAGKIINKMAAANQIIGAGVGGIGMALLEKQNYDELSGSMLDNDFAGYHVPVNADAPIIEVSFINKPDPHINPSGAKGLGEVGLIGSAAAIANAIYNATGRRMRHLPITPMNLVD